MWCKNRRHQTLPGQRFHNHFRTAFAAAPHVREVTDSFTFSTLYLLCLIVCAVLFSVKSDVIKNKFVSNFADRIDNTTLSSSYLITTLAFIAVGTLIMQEPLGSTKQPALEC